ncbi:unnamed protein product [Cladocopium goreaui]|uniref:Uncharacterized protein n=1 Tax=Cladocopium goreaui TaxID=2562237 RepID=A0A9P1CS67_9DINO|nr:unnamed protein product [Cladocopium goreaui]
MVCWVAFPRPANLTCANPGGFWTSCSAARIRPTGAPFWTAARASAGPGSTGWVGSTWWTWLNLTLVCWRKPKISKLPRTPTASLTQEVLHQHHSAGTTSSGPSGSCCI